MPRKRSKRKTSADPSRSTSHPERGASKPERRTPKKMGPPFKPDAERRRSHALPLYPTLDERLWLEERAREWFAKRPGERYSLAAATLHRALRGYPGPGRW